MICYAELLAAWRDALGPAAQDLRASVEGSEILRAILYLHYVSEAGDCRAGPTLARLEKFVLSRGSDSARALGARLWAAVRQGYVTTMTGSVESRATIYRPTARLIIHERIWCYGLLGCLDLLFRNTAYAGEFMRAPALFEQYFIAIYEKVFADVTPCAARPELARLLALDGALPTLCAYSEAHIAGHAPPHFREIAARFHISASQARGVAIAARNLGYLSTDRRGRILEVAALVEATRDVVAEELATVAKFALRLDEDAVERFDRVGPGGRIALTLGVQLH